MDNLNRSLGGFLGLAIGDTIGAQVEFKKRGSFPLVTDMVGGGVFKLRPGQTTDDTAMALIMARSLVHNQGFNPHHMMDLFLDWSRTSFDVGDTIRRALNRYSASKEPFQGQSHASMSGNGTIMRMYPSILWTLDLDEEEAFNLVWEISRLTHASDLIKDCTIKMMKVIRGAFQNKTKEEILEGLTIPANEPESSGFVVHTFEAAIWGFATTDNFKDGLLKVVNLGDDADTVAAVYGQIAGSFYGLDGLPKEWVEKLEDKKEIQALVSQLLRI